METPETPAQPEGSDKSSVTKPKKKKTTKEQTTLFGRFKNRVENHRIGALILGAAFIIVPVSIIYTCGSKGVKDAQVLVANVKSYFNLTNTKKSRVMKDPDGKALLSKIEQMYQDIMYDRFKAINYYAPHVDRYILVNNLSRKQVDSLYRKGTKDFVSPNAEIQDTAFYFKKEAGKKTLEFWIHMNVFRNSRAKYETCDVKVQFVFNDQNQILVYNELKTQHLKYSAEKG